MTKPTNSTDTLKFNPPDLKKSERAGKKLNPEKNKLLKDKGMQKDSTPTELKIFGENYFTNYELSWLKFNWRVLEQAQDSDNPLLERVKFIGIVCSNLDEFFQKRVGGLKKQQMAGVTELSIDGKSPEDQLQEIRREVIQMIRTLRSCFLDELIPELEKEGIYIREYDDLNKAQKKEADTYFEQQLYPIITPLAVDESHPFPFISNKSRSLAIKLKNPDNNEILFARIKIPANRPRWIVLEESDNKTVLFSVSDLIAKKIERFFPGMHVLSAHIFRVTRNADIERNEEQADDLLEMIEEELRERKFADIVRLEIDSNTPKDVKQYIYKQLMAGSEDIFEINGPIALADTTQLWELKGFKHLKYEPWTPALHPVFKHPIDEKAPSIFNTIRKGDFIVHHPYHSFESSTQRFVEDACQDPKVLAIKQTLYRTSSDSPLMHALIQAAESGKQVAILIELKARFDEERNISWAQRLEKAGVHVSYGITGLKIHTKLTIIVREERDGLRRYVHIGTGNYHPHTAQLYEDLGFFTCREDIASDVSDLFNLLTGYAPDQNYNKLLVAPKHLRNSIMEYINREIQEARADRPAKIIAKMNSLEDSLIIQELYEASQAGVEIDLIVRGVCRLMPGKPGLSENIRVHSIIGRFLEHSRCYYFYNSGAEEYHIGSADWMHRNLDARVEVLTPIEHPSLKEYLKFHLQLILSDNQQRWVMKPNGNYEKVKRDKSEKKISTHNTLMNHAKQSLDPIPKA